MNHQEITIGTRRCLLAVHGRPQIMLVQPIEQDSTGYFDLESSLIAEHTHVPFVLLTFTVSDWERELTPWPDPMLSKREEVGRHATDTLHDIESLLLPWLHEHYGEMPCVIGGYSLAALFALWCPYHTSAFAAVAGASPSVWLNHWPAYTEARRPDVQAVYLSQGNREEKTRNKTFASVGDNIRQYHALLAQQLGEDQCTLEWNEGNHFVDTDIRTAKAFAWCMNKVKSEN
jgi:predicted alpha/beta superfamily hydrolase